MSPVPAYFEVSRFDTYDEDGFPNGVEFGCAGFPNERDLEPLATLESRCPDCGESIGEHEHSTTDTYGREHEGIAWTPAFWCTPDAVLRCEDCAIAYVDSHRIP